VRGFDAGADPDVRVVTLSGELDAADVSWARALDAALDSGASKLVLDLRNVTFIDSSVIGAIVLAEQRIGDRGWLRIVYTHHVIRRLLEICGLAEILPQYLSVEAALRGQRAKTERR
jgi:stage II sporulation protein AA (anti-sigma F factor antagonist)